MFFKHKINLMEKINILSIGKFKILETIPNAEILFFNDSDSLKLNILKNFDSKKRYVILHPDCIEYFMLFTKMPESIVALVSDEHSAHMTCEHNNTNILLIPTDICAEKLILNIFYNFINSSYEDGRHKVRLDMLKAQEEGAYE